MQGEGEKQKEMRSLKVPGQTASPLCLGSSLQLNMYLETILGRVMEELVVFSIKGGWAKPWPAVHFPPPLGVTVSTR